MPTFERLARFEREFRRLPRELQRAFLAMLPMFVAALRETPPVFPATLRIHRVQGLTGIWEITFAPDGRATFEYGAEIVTGEPHIVWRRVGRHDVLSEPQGTTNYSLVDQANLQGLRSGLVGVCVSCPMFDAAGLALQPPQGGSLCVHRTSVPLAGRRRSWAGPVAVVVRARGTDPTFERMARGRNRLTRSI